MDVDPVNSLSRLAKEKGHRVHVMGVSSAVEHIFNETAMHARAQASNRLARANRASHGPRVRAKERVNNGKSKGKSKGTKGTKGAIQGAEGSHKGKTSTTGLSGLENSKSEPSSETRESAQTWPTDNSCHGFMMDGMVTNGTTAGVLTNGMMTGVLLDGTEVGNKRMTHQQAHFHWEGWISVPRAVRRDLNG